jgi:Protein of unknown function (DUF2752)
MDRGWRTWALAGAGGLLAVTALHFWVPPEGARFIICPFRRLTGLPCPGCGMTRAFAHLAKGEWSAAVRDQPLAPLLAAEMCIGWMAWSLPAAGRLRAAAVARLDRLALWHGFALCLVWVGRLATGTLPL